MKSVTETGNIGGKKVLVRVDWSTSQVDKFRIDTSMPTIDYLLGAGAEVILATHGDTKDLGQFVPNGAKLLPNLRDNEGEEKNSASFAKELSKYADIYVNEAFSASHRKHASIVGVPKILPSYAGFRFIEEVNALSKAFNPPHPALLILGGAKIDTKLPLVKKFSKIADSIFIGGAMVKDALGFIHDEKVFFSNNPGELDADDKTLEVLREKISEAEFIVWNGPLGKYEDGYAKYTHGLAIMLAESGKEVIVGGGDTLAAIHELGLQNRFTFTSTGGGAMLDFLANETLPGIEALG